MNTNTDQPTEAKPHNPANLTPEQVGVIDGWRLLDEDEVVASFQHFVTIEVWRDRWDSGGVPGKSWTGNGAGATYRTKLTRAELRKARGLEPEQPTNQLIGRDHDELREDATPDSPEQPKPVTPESLATQWIQDHWANAQSRTECFLAGYHANAERNAGIAQARDLAEEALKRHGFEFGVVNDVVTWVPTVRTWTDILSYEAHITALTIAAADYAKAAEASAALVEKLTRERDEARELVMASCGYATEALGNDYMAVSAGTRENVAQSIRVLRNERDTLRAELAAARDGLVRANQAHEANYHAALDKLNAQEDRLSAANAAREKARKRHSGATEAGA